MQQGFELGKISLHCMEADQRATSEYSESRIYDEVSMFKYKTKLVFCKQKGNACNA